MHTGIINYDTSIFSVFLFQNFINSHHNQSLTYASFALLGIAGGMQNLSLHQPSAVAARSLGTGNSQVRMRNITIIS